MSSLAERLKRLKWIAVPIAAYLAITVALPAANGAALDAAFLGHAAWVVAGCAAIAVVALVGGVAADLAVHGARRLVNRRRARGVVAAGGSP
jgi:hypothetical protein